MPLSRHHQRRWLRGLLVLSLVGIFGINGLAYMHAYSMSHFVDAPARTASPEKLSWLNKLEVLCTGVTLPKPENATTPAENGLQFETWSYETEDGLVLEAWYIPHQPTPGEESDESRGIVLAFHGYGGSKATELAAARIVGDLGFDSFLVDLRGAGGSEGETVTLGYEEAKDVAASVDFVRKLHPEKPIVLLGTSMGAAAILRAVAECNVTADALILESPFDNMHATVCNRFDRMGFPSFPMARLLMFWGGVQMGFSGFDHNPAANAKRVTIPTLHLHGARDTNVTADQAQNVFESLAGPKQFVPFEEIGHESFPNRSPTEWKTAVGQFLETHLSKAERRRPKAARLKG